MPFQAAGASTQSSAAPASPSACQLCGSLPSKVSESPACNDHDLSLNSRVELQGHRAADHMHEVDCRVDGVELVAARPSGSDAGSDGLKPAFPTRGEKAFDHASAAEIDPRGIFACDIFDIRRHEDVTDFDVQHLTKPHKGGDARRDQVPLTLLMNPLLRPVTVATCSIVSRWACRAARRRAPRQHESWSARWAVIARGFLGSVLTWRVACL